MTDNELRRICLEGLGYKVVKTPCRANRQAGEFMWVYHDNQGGSMIAGYCDESPTQELVWEWLLNEVGINDPLGIGLKSAYLQRDMLLKMRGILRIADEEIQVSHIRPNGLQYWNKWSQGVTPESFARVVCESFAAWLYERKKSEDSQSSGSGGECTMCAALSGCNIDCPKCSDEEKQS